ncbi:F-box domain containing protein [Pandoravirus quercus]|nr:F-box domain containing protein [Pandoravirus quercus]AVK75569.1 F-box domain containing protein [Pandoravirus quercus]
MKQGIVHASAQTTKKHRPTMLGQRRAMPAATPTIGPPCATESGSGSWPRTTPKRPQHEAADGLLDDHHHHHHQQQQSHRYNSAKRRRSSNEDSVTESYPGLIDEAHDDAIDSDDALPEEIYLLIAGHCDLPDLCRLARASRKWHRVVSDPRLWKAAYMRHLPACASPHRCRGVITDAIVDAAFFTSGLAALGVPNDDLIEASQESMQHVVPMDTEEEAHDEAGDRRESPIVQEIHFDAVPAEPPACIPPWAVAVGEALARCCARVARSSGQAYAHASVEARAAVAAAPPCRHVPPSLNDAFGLGARHPRPAGRVDFDGPQFVCSPSTRSGIAHRSARLFGHLRGIFEWPARLEAAGTHRAVLFTDGRSYTNTTDEVSMVLLLVDADGRAVWVLARAPPTESLAIDGADWCVAGPFAPSTIALPGAAETSMTAAEETSTEDTPPRTPPDALAECVPETPTTTRSAAILVGRRTDGTLVCAHTSRAPTFLSTVPGLLRSIDGPCVMRSRGSDAIYRGPVHHGLRTGHGVACAANGNLVYVGQWDDDLPTGKGTLYGSNDRVVFRGVFADGMPDGGAGLLCVPPRQASGRTCKVWARRWTRPTHLAQRTAPCGQGHVRLEDGTRLDCLWDRNGRPPVVVRVHVPAASPLALGGAPCVLDLTVRPPSLYDEALGLLDDDVGDTDFCLASDTQRRRRGAQAIEVPVNERRRRTAKARWTTRIPAPFIAAPLTMWPEELVPKPGDWVARTLAQPALCFAVDLAPHRPGRLVVDLLDH